MALGNRETGKSRMQIDNTDNKPTEHTGTLYDKVYKNINNMTIEHTVAWTIDMITGTYYENMSINNVATDHMNNGRNNIKEHIVTSMKSQKRHNLCSFREIDLHQSITPSFQFSVEHRHSMTSFRQ